MYWALDEYQVIEKPTNKKITLPARQSGFESPVASTAPKPTAENQGNTPVASAIEPAADPNAKTAVPTTTPKEISLSPMCTARLTSKSSGGEGRLRAAESPVS